MVIPGGRYCYHFDGMGNTVAITDMSQNIVNSYAYEPFGLITNQSETIPQPFKFVGQYGVMADPSGLYYMRARYYDPNVGRFISEDPLGLGGEDVNLFAYVDSVGKPTTGTNLYVYASNNPINRIDPLGLQDCPPGQVPKLDWNCVLTANAVGVSFIAPVWIAVPAGVTIFAAGGPFAWAGAGLAMSGAGLFGIMEGTIFSGCYKCVPDCHGNGGP
jgi:RHS repeat-associated protein